MAPPPMTAPEMMDDVTAEILLRLPPDEPELLFRAALVCKPWLRVLCDPGFLRRYRAFHGTPPLLGLLHRLQILQGNPEPRFSPTTAVPAFPYPVADGRRSWAHDCRHGRVFICVFGDWRVDYLVWDPVTGSRQVLPKPDIPWMAWSAAVFCADAGCNHLDCHGGPFHVVFMGSDDINGIIWASVYSSETGAWSTPTSLDGRDFYVRARRGALIGDEVFFSVARDTGIVKYDWGKNCLSVASPPPPATYNGWTALMEMEDSSLGLAGIDDPEFICGRGR